MIKLDNFGTDRRLATIRHHQPFELKHHGCMTFDFAGQIDLCDATVDFGILVCPSSTTVALKGSPTCESLVVRVSSRRIRSARSSGTLKGRLDAQRGEAPINTSSTSEPRCSEEP
jgi:hypothetical protein